MEITLKGTVTVDSTALKGAIEKLNAMLGDMTSGPMAEANMNAAGVWNTYLSGRFESLAAGGIVNGDRWNPLAPKTLKIKRSLGVPFPEKILVRYGPLGSSMNRGGENHFVQTQKDGVIEGTMDPKAPIHQYGYGVSPRPVVALPDTTTLIEIKNLAAGGVLASAKVAGFATE
jgi:hypothetical protein